MTYPYRGSSSGGTGVAVYPPAPSPNPGPTPSPILGPILGPAPPSPEFALWDHHTWWTLSGCTITDHHSFTRTCMTEGSSGSKILGFGESRRKSSENIAASASGLWSASVTGDFLGNSDGSTNASAKASWGSAVSKIKRGINNGNL